MEAEDGFSDPEAEGLVEEGFVHFEEGFELGDGTGCAFAGFAGCSVFLFFTGLRLEGVNNADLPGGEIVKVFGAVFKGEGYGAGAQGVHPA